MERQKWYEIVAPASVLQSVSVDEITPRLWLARRVAMSLRDLFPQYADEIGIESVTTIRRQIKI